MLFAIVLALMPFNQFSLDTLSAKRVVHFTDCCHKNDIVEQIGSENKNNLTYGRIATIQ
jgi:hypothetical protein